MNLDVENLQKFAFDPLQGPGRNAIPSHKSVVSITADIGHRCPHLDAYLPKFLDTQGLGIFSDIVGSHVLPHPSKRIRRSSISSLHLVSILNPSHYDDSVLSDRNKHSKNINTPKIVRYMLGNQEKTLDLHVSGLIGNTPLLPSTFMEQVLDEREFEVKASKYHDINLLPNHESKPRSYNLTSNPNKSENVPVKDGYLSLDSSRKFKDEIEIQNQNLSLRQSGTNQMFPIPRKINTDFIDKTEYFDIKDAMKCRDTDLKVANARIERWLDLIQENRTRYWNDTLKSSSIYCKSCRKRKAEDNLRESNDDLLQCLDCGIIACGVEFYTGVKSNRHMQRHLLREGHSFAISCGDEGKIFCMKCGDFVYNEVLDQEMERIDIGFHLPRFRWGRNQPLQRTFCFGKIGEDFIAIPSDYDDQCTETIPINSPYELPNHTVVWRGLRAAYPSEVPNKFIQAARSTLQRFRIFNGKDYPCYRGDTIDIPDSHRFNELQRKRKSDNHYFVQPVGL